VPRITIKDLEPISATKAKVIFGELLHQTAVNEKKFVIDRHGRPMSVILSYNKYLELLELAGKKT
jgi:hypothetical protein